MSSGFQLDLLPALRDWGLTVHEINGWQWRGDEVFNPGGSVNHHTAGSRRYSMPSLGILIEGRPDVPGPLAQVGQSRTTEFWPDADYDDVYLIAAGRANHAGSGGWDGLVGNSAVLGLEIEHTGSLDTEPFPERRAHTTYRIHCAFAEVAGFDARRVCQHKEWAPTRKIDFVGSDGAQFREAVALTGLAGPHPAPTPAPPTSTKGRMMIGFWIQALYAIARGSGYDVVVRQPTAFCHWSKVAIQAGSSWSAQAAALNKHMLPGLREEMKKRGLDPSTLPSIPTS